MEKIETIIEVFLYKDNTGQLYIKTSDSIVWEGMNCTSNTFAQDATKIKEYLTKNQSTLKCSYINLDDMDLIAVYSEGRIKKINLDLIDSISHDYIFGLQNFR